MMVRRWQVGRQYGGGRSHGGPGRRGVRLDGKPMGGLRVEIVVAVAGMSAVGGPLGRGAGALAAQAPDSVGTGE